MNLYNYDKDNETFLSLILEIYPTVEQKEKINDYIFKTNFVYDIIIDWMDDLYVKYMNDEINTKYLSKFDCDKKILELQEQNPYLQDVPQHILRQVFVRASVAYKRYLEKLSNHPKIHYPNNITNSFSIDLGNSFYIKDSYITLPGFANKSSCGKRVGPIKCQNLGIDSTTTKLYNGSIYIDNFGKYYFYATYKVNRIEFNYPKSKVIGIDLGYRLDGSNTIVCSNGSIYGIPNIQHLVSRVKYFQANQDLDKFRIAHRKLYDTLDTFYNQSTINIIKKNPEAIVIEDIFAGELKKGSKYNFIDYGYISSGKIRLMLIYKASLHKIPVYIAHRNFKSSYICSRCYHINSNDLKQKKIFKCEYCGYEIDRDLNASINLSNLYNFRNNFINYNSYIKEIIM